MTCASVPARRGGRMPRAATAIRVSGVLWGVLALVAAILPSTARAGEAVSFLLENDSFGGLDGTFSDRYYSNAIGAVYRRSDDDTSRFARDLAYRFFGRAETDPDRIVVEGFGITQSLFHPDNVAIARPLPNEHPYAAYLRLSYDWTVRHDGVIDSTQLALGLVGPGAGGEPVQRIWHNFIRADEPVGWDNQIETEPVVQLTWQRKWPRFTWLDLPVLDGDVRPVTEVNLGNGMTSAGVGVEVRIGNRLGSEFGAPRAGPVAPSDGFTEASPEGVSWFVFAGAEVRGVAQNLFIEGNTFRDSLGRDIEPLVHDVKVGAALRFERYQLSFTHISRSEEFDTQEGRHTFGLFTLSTSF